MDITELLVTAYNDEDPVLAVTLTPHTATAVRTVTDADKQVIVKDISHHDTNDTFTLVRGLVQGLTPTHTT